MSTITESSLVFGAFSVAIGCIFFVGIVILDLSYFIMKLKEENRCLREALTQQEEDGDQDQNQDTSFKLKIA